MDFSGYGVPSPEWEAFVQTNPTAGQPGRVPRDVTPEQIQRQTNAAREQAAAVLCAAHGLDEAVVQLTDYACPTRDGSSAAITVRAYRPTAAAGVERLPAFVYFHGGGYLFGSLGSERYLCGSLAAQLGLLVLHVCYRHTPVFVHPTAHCDGHDGLQWIADHGQVLGLDTDNVVVGGLSAGAAVAASAALAMRRPSGCRSEERPAAGRLRIRAVVLGIPWILHPDAFPVHLFARPAVASPVQCADAPVIAQDYIDFFTDLLQVNDAEDPLLNLPLRSNEELQCLPKTAIVVAGRDPLRDGGLLLADRLARLSIPTKVHVFKGLPHGFRRFTELPSTSRFDGLLEECIRWGFENGVETRQSTDWKIEGADV
ncbi:Alpha/beta hydrolase fold-3 [Niveomyces insectorum RCEF 264]|uniref:Alpha/beta hydrolase fold-3 n=1 Tax=Niveomyces insectorum RCEF 264 TaxID=1081102 RepID=A0A168AEG7_9HYPO|nr:Alpha/beta hydrolase fold-3 [Niveomyces insectorum RCEF 264]